MKKLFTIVSIFSVVALHAQYQPPLAVPDSAETMAQIPVEINVLLNDYDPDGDTIEIYNLKNPEHGDSWYEDSIVTYKSEYYAGLDSMRYRIIELNNGQISEYAYIFVNVLENPDLPYAVNDTFTIRKLEPTVLGILANDGDPNGDAIKVADYSLHTNMLSAEYAIDSSYIILSTKYIDRDNWIIDYINVERNTPEAYHSNEADVYLIIEDNPELPVVIEDYYEITGGISFAMDVTVNDIIPLSEPIEFDIISHHPNGSVSTDGTTIHYTADTSFAGNDSFKYSIRYVNKPWLYSERDTVNLYVNKNPNCPVGVIDYGSGLAYTPITIDVLSNDYDPNGEPIEIMDVQTFSIFSAATFDGNLITYTSNAFYIGTDSIQYRIMQQNNHNYYSEWTSVYFNISQNPEFPVTDDDFAFTKGGVPVIIDVLKNDIIPDTFEFLLGTFPPSPLKGKTECIDSTIIYTPYMTSYGVDYFYYVLKNMDIFPYYFARGTVYIEIEKSYSYDSLTINNINAGIHSGGLLFSRADEMPGQWLANFGPHFEVPKGGGKHTFFTHNTWIGGLSNGDSLHLAGERFKQQGSDFQPGPVSNNYDFAYVYNWNGLWTLYKEEVEYHRNNWWKEGYEAIRNIAEWPGNGDPAYGQADQLAPYYDYDNNNIYDPMQGDYPLIRGDQCIFFIYNDDRVHTETDGERLIIEIHGMAHAFDSPEDSVLNNTIFVHYDLINRSENTYYDCYFGIFADLEIGYAWDDYIGSYVSGSSFYSYNGLEIDGNGEPEAYGENPPAQSVTVLAGPFMDPDQQDNPAGGCDHSVTGTNFGNDIIDDERYGLTRFTYFNNAGGPQGDPYIAEEYYNYLSGFWKDDSPIIFGGSGHANSGGDWSECRFMFPGESDPLNWGTDCVLPYGGYNQNGQWWTMELEGFSPDDRRGMGSCGPFTFHPGEVQEIELAYICANSYEGADSSKKLLFQYIDDLRQRVQNGEIIIPNEELDIKEAAAAQASFEIYPNPAGEAIHLTLDNIDKAEYRIVNSFGTIVQTGVITPDTRNEINISGLKPGFYIITVTTDKGSAASKFIKY
ncbi:MAG: T9SS type A sorting domain-containing protein [Bacteroidetes bacterium]|nr:T9SS type A sorting domain-containing protein [Bacteroidota bacterium]